MDKEAHQRSSPNPVIHSMKGVFMPAHSGQDPAIPSASTQSVPLTWREALGLQQIPLGIQLASNDLPKPVRMMFALESENIVTLEGKESHGAKRASQRLLPRSTPRLLLPPPQRPQEGQYYRSHFTEEENRGSDYLRTCPEPRRKATDSARGAPPTRILSLDAALIPILCTAFFLLSS